MNALERAAEVARIRRAAASGEMRRRRRSAEGLQAELADAIGVSGATISEWEHGKARPKADHALRWEEALRRIEGDVSPIESRTA